MKDGTARDIPAMWTTRPARPFPDTRCRAAAPGENAPRKSRFSEESWPWPTSSTQLSSERVYKEAWRETKILRTIHDGSGTQFDPELVDIFFSRLDVIRSIQSRYEEEPDLAFDFESDPVHLAKIVLEGKPYWEL